jgi:nitroreductase
VRSSWRSPRATAGTPLAGINQAWGSNAGALLAVISRKLYEHNGSPAPAHGFDAGSAWMSLALQATHMGLVSHGMQGFDHAAEREVLAVPEVYDLHALIAVGHPDEVDELPQHLRKREVPSSRKALEEIAFEGGFGGLAS